jgi:hypothetical protein
MSKDSLEKKRKRRCYLPHFCSDCCCLPLINRPGGLPPPVGGECGGGGKGGALLDSASLVGLGWHVKFWTLAPISWRTGGLENITVVARHRSCS